MKPLTIIGIGGLGDTSGADIEIYGYDLAKLQKISRRVEEEIKKVPGVMDVNNSLGEEGRPQLTLKYKRDKLYLR